MPVTDWIDLTRGIEGYYSLAKGTVNGGVGDETLRRNLVSYANVLFIELMQMRRWGYSYGRSTFAITSAQSEVLNVLTPLTPASGTGTFLTVRRLWFNDSAGFPQVVKPWDSRTLDPTFGLGGTAPAGRPEYYFNVGEGTLRMYPKPDTTYSLWVEGELNINPIVETVGTIAGPPTTTLTVPSSTFLTSAPNSLVTSSLLGGISVMGAGYQQYATGAADLVLPGWTNIAGNAVTLSAAAQTAVATLPCFLRSQNWLIANFPKLVLFGVLREVATYFKSNDDYKLWESRFQHEIELAMDHDNDRLTANDKLGVGLAGQDQNAIRSVDAIPGFDVRGGII